MWLSSNPFFLIFFSPEVTKLFIFIKLKLRSVNQPVKAHQILNIVRVEVTLGTKPSKEQESGPSVPKCDQVRKSTEDC